MRISIRTSRNQHRIVNCRLRIFKIELALFLDIIYVLRPVGFGLGIKVYNKLKFESLCLGG